MIAFNLTRAAAVITSAAANGSGSNLAKAHTGTIRRKPILLWRQNFQGGAIGYGGLIQSANDFGPEGACCTHPNLSRFKGRGGTT